MVIDVLLEPLPTTGYRASCRQPWVESVQAGTREEALADLQKRIESQWTSGTELVRLQIALPPTVPPAWPDDQFTGDWLAGIEEVRRVADREVAGGPPA